MSDTAPTADPLVLTSYAEAKQAYHAQHLRQALYDEGEVIMADVLINLHGVDHRARRRIENKAFQRETFEHYERDLFPRILDETLAPAVQAGHADLVRLSHHLMLHLAARTAGVDRSEGTAEETQRLYTHLMRFIEGATLAHSTKDKDEQRRRVSAGLADWNHEFLEPSIARRRALLERAAAGEEIEPPRDVLTTLLQHREELNLADAVLQREVAFFMLAAAHTTATALVRSTDHILAWLQAHPEDTDAISGDRTFIQRCVHETLRLNPSSPVGRRRATAPISLGDGTRIPEGAVVVLDLRRINRDPSVFGDDADTFNPRRPLPPGIPPYGLSFAAGPHVCIGQDMAAGTVTRTDSPDDHLFGVLAIAVRRLLAAAVRRDPGDPPERDQNTVRPYWSRYPVLFGKEESDGSYRRTR